MDLLDTVSKYLGPEVVSKLSAGAGISGEDPANLSKAAGAAAPTLLAGITQTASTEHGAQRLFGALGQSDYGDLLGKLGTASGSTATAMVTQGKALTEHLFGEHASGVTQLVGRFAGLRPESSAGVTGIVMSVVAGVIGRETAAKGLGASDLAGLLVSQKKSFLESPNAPPGLASALHLGKGEDKIGKIGETAKEEVRELRPPASTTVPRKSRVPMFPLLLFCALLIFAGYTLRRNRAPRVGETPTGTPPVVEQLTPTSEDIHLPSGGVVTVGRNSGEADLAHYLGSNAAELPKSFSMGGLDYATGSANLLPDSYGRVDTLATLMKAYPASRVRLVGHTDTTGDDAQNKTLSMTRAEDMRNRLIAQGIEPSRVQIDGVGSTRPIAPNDTEEGRALNRRMEIVLLAR